MDTLKPMSEENQGNQLKSKFEKIYYKILYLYRLHCDLYVSYT